jgi:purine-binding chemotaxis protein CheW
MKPTTSFVIFALDAHLFALELTSIHRVVRASEVTPLPHAPPVIMGVINVQGKLFPVVNLRHRFRLLEREIMPSDQFILVDRTEAQVTPSQFAQSMQSQSSTLPSVMPPIGRRLALAVDSVMDIRTFNADELVVGDELIPHLEHVQGVAKIADTLILIQDLDRCLSLHEERMLDDALAKISA